MRIGKTSGLFRPERPDAEPFTIVMPPPNVTGSLHIGHALDNTLQDILPATRGCRARTRCGWSAPTMPASPPRWWSSATSTSQGVKRTDYQPRGVRRASLGVEGAERAAQITRQLRRLGASCDWANERFTMDEGFSARGHQGVRRALQARACSIATSGWSTGTPSSRPRSATSRSRRARSRASSGTSAIRSPTAAASIQVATTRPETMLADMAVAVHPDDERYTALVGKQVQAADHRPADPDRRRRACRSRARLGRGQDHAGPRLQRFRGRQARRVQARRHAQHARCARRGSSRPRTG